MLQDLSQRFPHRRHMRLIEGGLAVLGGKARGVEQCIALAEWHFQGFGQTQDHVAAGFAATGFQPAQVALGDLSTFCQVQLRQMTGSAPVLAELWKGGGGNGYECFPAARKPRRPEVAIVLFTRG